ncbi:MAG TPA: hypothetical protein DDX92_14090 [Flavobacteriales bacterium]|jgi:hypothetical protein|nr:hypothetical protein [Flavobacteriales bacterium]
MKLPQWTIILLTMLTSVHVHGQDTISVFFDFGHSKILYSELEKLNAIPINYDLSDLDSIHFIGMADSVGDFKANIKLSEKRAKNVARHCERLFPENVTTKITALGERTIDESEKNRRVDIILHFKPIQAEQVEQTEDIQKKEVCYNIDYKLLHRCHLRIVTKRKKELTIIETNIPDLRKNKEHYYGSTSKNGDFLAKKVKWSSKRTGNLWWAETRYVATIPKEDFDTYKIFKIEDLPCDTCSEDFQSKASISKEDTCVQVDRFLMENIQFKTSLFNRNSVKIRTPREYINLEDRYFIGCGFQNELVWDTKKGRRKQNYYYSRLPRHFNYISNITRVMDCCKNNPEPSECDRPLIFCRTLGEPDRSFILNAEIGSHYQQSTLTPYTGLGISKEGYFSRVSILAGTDIDLSFYGSLRYQYHFLSFPFSAMNPFSTWQSPTSQQVINRYGRLYLGTEIKTRFNENKQDYLEQNVHIGLAAVNTNRDALIPRIFIQYGIGFDYLGTYATGAYSIVQLGLNMKIARLNKK